MEFQGRIYKVLEKRSGVSQRTGNTWVSQEFIFEYFEHDTDRFSDQVVLETIKPEFIEKIVEGAEVRIGFGHRIEEYQGRYYNRLNMYKLEVLNTPEQEQAAPLTNDIDGKEPPF